jgi:hypothetical protein
MLKFVKQLLADVASLRRPVTAAAVVAVVVEVLPGVHINGAIIAGVLVGVGVIAAFVENQFPKSPPAPPPAPAKVSRTRKS